MKGRQWVPWALILTLCSAACGAGAPPVTRVAPSPTPIASPVALSTRPAITPIPTIAAAVPTSPVPAPTGSPTVVSTPAPTPLPTRIAPTARICSQTRSPIDILPYQVAELTYLSDVELRVIGLTESSGHVPLDVGLTAGSSVVSRTRAVTAINDPCRGRCSLTVLSESPKGSIQTLSANSSDVALGLGGEWFVGKTWAKRWSDYRRGGGRVFWSDDERLVYRYWPVGIYGNDSEILVFSGSFSGPSAPSVVSLTLPVEFAPTNNIVGLRPDDKTLYSIGVSGQQTERQFTAWKVEGSLLMRLWSTPASGVKKIFWQNKEKRVLLGVVHDRRFYVVPLADDHRIDLSTALIEFGLAPSMEWVGVFGPQVAVSPDLTSIAFSNGTEISVYDCAQGP